MAVRTPLRILYDDQNRPVGLAELAANDTFEKSSVGLGNVDNTSDANKPVSTAQQSALDQKVNTSSVQTSQSDRTNNALMRVGAFGLGKFFDLRPLGISGTTPPSTFFSTGTMTGFINGGTASGESTLAIPALGAVVAYGVLTVHGHWSDETGGGGVQQIFTTGSRTFTRLPASASAWQGWKEMAFTDNATFIGSVTRFLTEVVRHEPGAGISAGYEIGSVAGRATTPYLDFHSGATATDFDFRLLFSGGDGNSGRGNASFNGAMTTFNCQVKFTSPVEYPNYTPSTLPSAAAHNTRVINVTNATGGQKLCQSDGNAWKVLNTGNTVA